MASEWRTVALGDICELKAGSAFKLDSQGRTSGDYPFIKVSDMNLPANALRIHESNNWIGDDDLAALRAKPFPPGTVVFAKIGEALRQNRLRQLVRSTVVDNNMMGAVPDAAVVDPGFFFYALARFDFASLAQGTALPYLTVTNLSKLEVEVPPLPEQRAIAHILGKLDDKIELNRRMNETLEAMARALFKSWFIDFDPVIDNALAAGNPIPDQFKQRAQARAQRLQDPNAQILPDPTRKLFPNQFQHSPLGPIPTGWSVEEVGSVVDCVGGSTPSTKEPRFWDGGAFHWTTPKDLSGARAPFLLQTDRKITEEGVRAISSGMLPVGTVLMSSRAPVGYLAIAAIPVAINQGFIAIKPNDRASTEYMLNWCQANLDAIKGRATGTTFAEISKSAFRPMLMLVPPRPVMDEFTKGAHPLYARLECALREDTELAAVRDALLPKLISGEVRIQEPLKFIGGEQ